MKLYIGLITQSQRTLNFFKLNIEKFNTSITRNELSNALKLAENLIKTSPQDKRIIFHFCMSVLSDSNVTEWVRKMTL